MPIASLIIKIGADMADLKQNAEKATGILGKMDSVVSTVGKSLAVYFSGQAILGAVNAVIDFAGAMVDLSARTGIGVEALQAFKYAADQGGSSIEAVVSAVGKLQNNLAEGSSSTVAALDALGLKLEDLRAMSPEQQFTVVADALGKVKDQTQFVQVGMDLMGKGFLEVAPMIREGFSELVDAAREAGIIIDTDTVAAMESLGDATEATKAAGLAFIAEVLKPFLPLLMEASKWMIEIGSAGRAGMTMAQTAFEQFISIVAGGLAKFTSWTGKMLEAININGIFDSDIKKIAESTRYWDAISKDLATTQTKVAKETKAAAVVIGETAEAKKNAAREAKELAGIMDRLWGEDKIAQAGQYLQAIKNMNAQGHEPMKSAWEGIVKIVVEAQKALTETGRAGTQMFADLEAARRKFSHLTADGLIPSTPMKTSLEFMNVIPQVIDKTTNAITSASVATAQYATEAQFTNGVIDEGVIIIGDNAKAQRDLARQNDSTAGSFARMGASAQNAFQMMVPPDFDWAKAYRDAGIFVSGSNIGLRSTPFKGYATGTSGYENFGTGTPVMLHGWEKVTPYGAGGDGPSVAVNLHVGTFVGSDRTAVRELSNMVGDEIMRRLGGRRKLAAS